jgi:hypothetical protein
MAFTAFSLAFCKVVPMFSSSAVYFIVDGFIYNLFNLFFISWHGKVLPIMILYQLSNVNNLANMIRVMSQLPVNGVHYC